MNFVPPSETDRLASTLVSIKTVVCAGMKLVYLFHLNKKVKLQHERYTIMHDYYITCFNLLFPDSLPDTQPSLKKILAELNTCTQENKWKVERNWFDIGIQLDVPASNLQFIRRENHDEGPMGAHYDDRSFRDMLSQALEQKKPSPTWLSLVKAFMLSNCPEFADQLRSKYCKYLLL